MVLVAKLITIGAKLRDAWEWYWDKKTLRVEWTEVFAIIAELFELIAWFLDEEGRSASLIKNIWAFDVFLSTGIYASIYVIKNIRKFKIYKICRTYMLYMKIRRKSTEIRNDDIELGEITTSA
uniref:Uncharacterized protein n=1 Tax=Aedes albopictus TaxID=7160 RepID=A0A1W7R453_AEDAL